MRLSFAVDLAELPDGRFRISVTSPVGEVTTDVANPFSPDDIARYARVLNPETPGISASERENTVHELGDRLYQFIFLASPQIQAAYFTSLDRAGNDGLRILFTVERAGALAGLPWEALRDPARDHLALSRSTPIIRYTKQLSIRPPVPVAMPLRVLVVISSPAGLPALDVEAEWNRLNEATRSLRAQGLIALERLERATLSDLQRTLRRREYHALHVIGHSDFDSRTNRGVLVFEQEDGSPQIVTAAELGREIGEESTIRMVLLNSCRSAERPRGDGAAVSLMGIASNLITRGIPAVVAMQFPISDRAAQIFSEEFYHALAEFIPIDSAISEARRAVANQLRSTEWLTPTLFMRTDEGKLFTPMDSAPEDAQEAPEPAVINRDLMRWGGCAGLAIITLIILLVLASRPDPVVTPTLTPTPTATSAPTLTPTPAGLADLRVSSVRISPRQPAPGQLFQLNVTFTNAGVVDTGAFSYAWDADSTDPATQNAFVGTAPNIPPGASRSIIFPYSFGWWGTYNSQFIVDALSEVAESNELNNRFPFAITLLQDQPFVLDFSILPDLSFVEPPIVMARDAYAAWNLDFSLAGECIDSPLGFLDIAGDVVIAPQAAADDPCRTAALSISFTRAPLSDAQIELLPLSSGRAQAAFFSAENDAAPVQIVEIDVTAGMLARLAPETNPNAPLRLTRVEVSMTGQPARLTRLILFPPP
jgi:hypothetical protein